MEITVRMTAEELMEFMEWRRDKAAENREIQELAKALEELANKVFDAMDEPGEAEKAEYKIKSQAAAAELYAEAIEAFRRVGS